MNIILQFLTLLSISSPQENQLRTHLFKDYHSEIRPVRNYSKTLNVEQGLAVQTLESFNQIDETLSLNLWLRSNWYDEYLRWNDTNKTNLKDLTFLSVTSDDIWTPDTELLNAATKPDIYLLQGGINLYQDGYILYSKPGIYKSSCSLDLKEFPFDSQNCTLLFGSWVYNDMYVNLKPYKDVNKQVDILSSFSHSEWDVQNVEVRHLKEERSCCPGEEFDLLSYSFIFKRYTHYYKISMGMTITLVVVSFIITLMGPGNVSRTSTAVFIPLTILALQLTIANKIPVVGYYTLMDKFFLCCFITSMICSIESGLIYALITTKSVRFYNFLDRFFKLNLDNENDNIELNEVTEEYNTVTEILTSVAEGKEKIENIEMEMSDVEDGENNTDDDVPNRYFNDVYMEKNNIQKVIDMEDSRLSFTPRQKKIDELINRYISRTDTIVRIILPIVFFSYIIYIFSYDE